MRLKQVVEVHDKNAIYAKRLKRLVSIYLKLHRFKKMKLKNVQDIGGCRAIVSNEKQLRRVVKELKKLPEIKHTPGRYRSKDYIKRPKYDGYRSYHIVGKFSNNDGNDMAIEFQIRTRVQHYWATAVEIVDLFTGQALKSSLGEEEWRDFFFEMSNQMAIIEKIPSFFELDVMDQFKAYLKILGQDDAQLDQCLKIQDLSAKISVAEKFAAFASSLRVVDDKLTDSVDEGFVLLRIDTKTGNLTSKIYPKDEGAIASSDYTVMETKAESEIGVVVALVSSSAVGGVREAYPNYFADSSEFSNILEIINTVKNPRQMVFFGQVVDTPMT